MNDKDKQTQEKLRGGYYTPKVIADFLTSWSMNGNVINSLDILEPSAGDGIFVESLMKYNNVQVTAIEIMKSEYQKILNKVEEKSNFIIKNTDFYDFYKVFKKEEKKYYDIILGNPPYIRYQYLKEEQRDFQTNILEANGIKPNRLINAWMAFTVASVEMLKESGKIGLVLPTDLLQVSYAKQLREFLFENLHNLTIITFDKLVFNDIQQDVVLLLGEKKREGQSEHNLRVINLKNLEELQPDKLDVPFDTYESYDSEKWTKFYLSRDERNFYETTFMKKTDEFNKYAKGEIGITTGNNKFFVIDDNLMRKYNLKKYTRPLLGRSVEVNGLFYKSEDLEKNIILGQNVWLLDFNGQKLSKKAQGYIDYGEENKQNEGYKLSLRNRWYDIPSIWVPHAFMLRRIGKLPRVIKNNIEATSTDTFHRVRFKEGTNINKLLFLMYSSPTLLSFELEGRVFGGGALEILPGDLYNIRLPLVENNLNFDELVEELDSKLRDSEPVEEIVKWVDNQLKQNAMFTDKQIDKTFIMWKKLNDRRTNK